MIRDKDNKLHWKHIQQIHNVQSQHHSSMHKGLLHKTEIFKDQVAKISAVYFSSASQIFKVLIGCTLSSKPGWEVRAVIYLDERDMHKGTVKETTCTKITLFVIFLKFP
ncbi:hypothetical protein ATANTOWER_016823 [Ataeniobius toweri]|uniref:Uncharacterized protein n=1 Tax=Ataeniobius toweri TaxID=208326 RepID=A0ABU7BKW1_9TELE|nr:hypothetical protein [Ataeniobius toweri]